MINKAIKSNAVSGKVKSSSSNTNLRSLAAAIMATGLCGSPLVAMAQEGPAQQAGQATSRVKVLEEVLVTAQRREQSAQDVPISMTVFNQDQLNDNNIFDASDLGTYTTSMQVNNRFGADAATFQIRGFSQELRTTASVGVYFAEVVAPRGANTSASGDGAGPGDFFDLANVQVLKGPQGTLFGRNTTGGAVLLTPQKPTDESEGYIELSGGNYGMARMQGVANLPLTDKVRMRFGLDKQQRDGYLDNKSGVGPDELANLAYTAVRASIVWDITENVENYTILKTAHSENDGVTSVLVACNPDQTAGFASFCQGDLANRQATGADGFYDVWSNMEDPRAEKQQRQVINTTTWDVNENLTVKNIISYATFEFWLENMVFGTNWQIPTGGGNREIIFAMAGLADGAKQADSSTFVEELQFQGKSFDNRLTWQAGIYYEKTEPENDYGSQSPALISCDRATIKERDPNNWRCNDVLAASFAFQTYNGAAFTSGSSPFLPIPAPAGFDNVYVGSLTSSPGGVTYDNRAVYFQGTYDVSEQLAITLGIRYTDDKTEGKVAETIAYFSGDIATGAYYAPDAVITNKRNPKAESDEPTGMLGVDYKPTDDLMFYAKYTRGYRQGSVNLAGADGYDTHKPEKVNAYEIGAKTQWGRIIPATANISLFYNDFQDQQVQYGYRRADTGTGTTAIINAGESTIQGLEIEANFLLTDDLQLLLSYSYLDTEVEDIETPNIPANVASPGTLSINAAKGDPLTYAPENQLVATLAYDLPLDQQKWGVVGAAVSYVYNDEMNATSESVSPYAVIDSYDLVNVSLNWRSVLGSRFDASAFVNNATDEEYINYMSGAWNTGLEMSQPGLPRMYGMRLRYSF